MPRGGHLREQLGGGPLRRGGTGQQDRRIDIALHGALGIAPLQLAEVEAPVGGERFGG
ncbi:hypothetical protein D3C83_298330 [compost metagenome]